MSESEITPFDIILSLDNSFFKQHVTLQFATENILFYQEVEQWRWAYMLELDSGGHITEDLIQQAFSIHDRFIRPGAALELNVSGSKRNAMDEYFNRKRAQHDKTHGVTRSPRTSAASSAPKPKSSLVDDSEELNEQKHAKKKSSIDALSQDPVRATDPDLNNIEAEIPITIFESLKKTTRSLLQDMFPQFNLKVSTAVHHSWKLLVQEKTPEEIGEVYYVRLFQIAPQLKPIFAHAGKNQSKMFMTVIGTAVSLLFDMKSLLPVLHKLAVRHIRYGVQKEFFTYIGEALIQTLGELLGKERWTEEVRESWKQVYELMAAVMIGGMSIASQPHKVSAFQKPAFFRLGTRNSDDGKESSSQSTGRKSGHFPGLHLPTTPSNDHSDGGTHEPPHSAHRQSGDLLAPKRSVFGPATDEKLTPKTSQTQEKPNSGGGCCNLM